MQYHVTVHDVLAVLSVADSIDTEKVTCWQRRGWEGSGKMNISNKKNIDFQHSKKVTLPSRM
jgi:hypothetical protein